MVPKQFIKWIGNKTKFADQIVSLMPERIDTYFEPFLGSGAVLGALLQRSIEDNVITLNKAVASDTLKPLIDLFDLLKNDPSKLIIYYEEIINRFNLDRANVYTEVRNRFNENPNPYDFLILSRTCYSGVIRFRKSDGYMSTPIGPHKPISPLEFSQRANHWSKLVKNVLFMNADFKLVFDMAKSGDLIYCDPPYTHSQSILYGSQQFDINELWECIKIAKSRGVNVMLSLNGKNKSGKDISTPIPDGLFQRQCYIDCGISMVNRLQNSGGTMKNESVHDLLLLTW